MKHIIDLSASIEETKKAKTVLFYSTAAVVDGGVSAGRWPPARAPVETICFVAPPL